MTTQSDFSKLVSDDIKNLVSADQAKFLRAPESRRDWLDQLVLIRAQIQSQLSSRRAKMEEIRLKGETKWEEAVAEYTRWKADVLRFNCSLEDRLREAKRLIRETNEENKDIERNRMLETLAIISTRLSRIEDLLLEEADE